MGRYVCRQRARFTSLAKKTDGTYEKVNIPYGTMIHESNGYLFYKDKPLCRINSQLACDFFSCNNDNQGLLRGNLIGRIFKRLKPKIDKRGRRLSDPEHQERWDRVWQDERCQKYREAVEPDYWFWNIAFYHAPIEDLKHIAGLIAA